MAILPCPAITLSEESTRSRKSFCGRVHVCLCDQVKERREREEKTKKVVSQKLFAQYENHIVTQQGNVVPYGYKN